MLPRVESVTHNLHFQVFVCGLNQARNQGGGIWGISPPPKFSKHCIAILIFVETLKE